MEVLETNKICTFYVGIHYIGVPVLEVQEVFRQRPMTRVPLAGDEIGGLINLRGQIVTAIDLRRRLGIPIEDESVTMNIVVRNEQGDMVSLLVDRIEDIEEPTPECFEPTSGRDGTLMSYMQGAYKMEGRLLLLLDVTKTLDVAA